jgi:AcrR family transcriptional regulator
MARLERKTETGISVRQQIMDAASELFVSEGYENTSMRKIANKIGYSPTTIYLYFRDKADLLGQICDAIFSQLTRNITAINSLSGEPIDKLRLGLKEYILFGLRHPMHYQLLFGMRILVDDGEFAGSEGARAFDTLRAAVTECVSANLLRSNDIELISQTLWTGIHGVTSLLNTQPMFPWLEREKVIDSVLDMLTAGIIA